MINYTVIKACRSSNCVFIHEGLHMELHLHLNVFMGGMFLSSGLRLEGRIGSIEATKCGGLSEHSVEVVKPNWESCMNGQLVVYKPQHRSHTIRDFQCVLRGKTNLSYGSVDKWFIEIRVERASKSILSPLL